MPEATGDELLEGTVTVAFSDVEGSTDLVQRLGDEKFLEVIRFLDHTTERLAKDARGHVPRHEGDGWMVVFGSARRAARWAIDLQRAIADGPDLITHNDVAVRIGLHTGEAIQSGRDFIGVHVNMAARIADQAAGGEIVMSAITDTIVKGSSALRVGEPQLRDLKGFSEPVFVYPIDWRSDHEPSDSPPAVRREE